jgi:hypothetical protein
MARARRVCKGSPMAEATSRLAACQERLAVSSQKLRRSRYAGERAAGRGAQTRLFQ